MVAKDLSGQKFGYLTVLQRDTSKTSRAYWLCECVCGKKISVSGTKLRNGQKSCGCMNKKDLTNQKFGLLTAIKETENRASNGSIIWECLCDCGKVVQVRRDSLLSGRTKSCGCLQQAQNLINIHQEEKDISNQKFGNLLAIRPDKVLSQKFQRPYWICRCDCGNEISVRKSHLVAQEIVSCGCKKSSSGEIVIEEILKQNNIQYQKEYTNNNLINDKTNSKLRFDFAIYDKNKQNILCFVEFDGKQHFEETNFFSDSLKEIQYRDKIKNLYCEKNNILLFRIPYTALKKIHNIYDIFNIKYLYKGE